MAYGRNFGFRSFENIIRDGRFRAPATGDALPIGSAVEVNPGETGRLRPVTAEEAPSQLGGIVLYEHIQMRGVDPNLATPSDFDYVPKGQYAQFIHGIGVKVWFRNTEDDPLYDGRQISGRTMVAGLGATPTIAVGDGLVPADPTGDGAYWKEAGTAANAWLIVEHLDAANGLVECRFTF